MQMLEIVRYSQVHKAVWDAFVAGSKNGTFLFFRDYMEYHAHRVTDHSLLFFLKGKLIALLPANEVGQELHSHSGLSYGGIISGNSMRAAIMLRVFDAMLVYLRKVGFTRLNYKAIPHIYHLTPAEEDLYALYRSGASLCRRELNSVICLDNPLPYSQLRKRKLKDVQAESLNLQQSFDFVSFMKLEQELLQTKYNLIPTHSSEEMEKLAQQFPEHIKLFAAYEAAEMVAGIIIYETETVVHCQYIGATERGKHLSALDALTDFLLTSIYKQKRYFSFGISTEQGGRYLNENLVRNKESYGARAVVQDFYTLELEGK